MKKINTILVAALITTTGWAQAPEKINYQAVIRDGNNQLVTNTSIGMQISILRSAATGIAVYTETQTPVTNANGLVTIEIGTGTVVAGDFSTIDWANDTYFLKTETDPAGGNNYTITGTSQLLSVPYSLHAKTAESIAGGINETDPVFTSYPAYYITSKDITHINDLSGVNTGDQRLSVSDHNLTIENGNTITLPDNDNQTLFLNGVTLYIYGGNSVDLGTLGSYWKLTGNAGTDPSSDFIGTTDDQPLTIRTNNTEKIRITSKGQIEVLNTGNSVFVGEGAGANDALSHNENSFIGYQSGYSNTTGYRNTANGYRTLYSNTTGVDNTAIGHASLWKNDTGHDNTAVGDGSLSYNLKGNENTAVGSGALYYNTFGYYNTAVGYRALFFNTTGHGNTANGCCIILQYRRV